MLLVRKTAKKFLTDMKFKEYKGLDLAGVAAEVLGEWDARDTFHKRHIRSVQVKLITVGKLHCITYNA